MFCCRAYFAISLVNVLTELLESKQENIHILGCQTLANFINSQVGHVNQPYSVGSRIIGHYDFLFEACIMIQFSPAYKQVDNTYARNIESLVHKVCALSRQQGEEHRLLRAASLQCLSAMVIHSSLLSSL